MVESESEKVKVTCGQVCWPILRISALHLTHPKCTHTAVNTHTPWTHTRSSGQPFMLRHPGSSWGFGVLLKGTSVVVLKEERALYIHSLHLQFLPAWDSNSQPLDYESDSLTIRPQLPPIWEIQEMTFLSSWVFLVPQGTFNIHGIFPLHERFCTVEKDSFDYQCVIKKEEGGGGSSIALLLKKTIVTFIFKSVN